MAFVYPFLPKSGSSFPSATRIGFFNRALLDFMCSYKFSSENPWVPSLMTILLLMNILMFIICDNGSLFNFSFDQLSHHSQMIQLFPQMHLFKYHAQLLHVCLESYIFYGKEIIHGLFTSQISTTDSCKMVHCNLNNFCQLIKAYISALHWLWILTTFI